MIATTLGGRLDAARTAKGLTRAQLAVSLGVMSKTIKNWETDRSEPRANKLVTLSGVLGVPVTWLATGQEPEYGEQPDVEETAVMAEKMERLLTLHDQMTVLLYEVQGEVNRLQKQFDDSDDDDDGTTSGNGSDTEL